MNNPRMTPAERQYEEDKQAILAAEKGRSTYRVKIYDLPPGMVTAAKKEVWALLNGPDVNGNVKATLTLELGITDEQAEKLASNLDDGWVNHVIERVVETSEGTYVPLHEAVNRYKAQRKWQEAQEADVASKSNSARAAN